MSGLKHYPGFLLCLANKEINLNLDCFKVMLVSSTYQPAKSHRYLSSITGEVSCDGYDSGGVVITGADFVSDDSGDSFSQNAKPVTFERITVKNVRYAIIYDASPVLDSGKPLVAYYDFGKAINTMNSDIVIAWDDNRIIKITC